MSARKLITKYTILEAIPYVLLSAVLLTAILFTQQAGRFSELAVYADLPLGLAAEIADHHGRRRVEGERRGDILPMQFRVVGRLDDGAGDQVER